MENTRFCIVVLSLVSVCGTQAQHAERCNTHKYVVIKTRDAGYYAIIRNHPAHRGDIVDSLRILVVVVQPTITVYIEKARVACENSAHWRFMHPYLFP